MITDSLRYDKWIEEALRGVIRRVLVQTAAEGLPGDHHFYITFRTKADGVVLPGKLLAQHPDEMTIVLQHQFDDLVVDEDAFQVTLYFKGKGERLRVPLAAVTAFADPSVNFGLELKTIKVPGKALDLASGSEDPAAAAGAPTGDGEAISPDNDQSAKEDKMGQVIALDAFRKK